MFGKGFLLAIFH